IHSVFRKADEAGITFDKKQAMNERFETVTHEAEIKIAKKLAEWPRLVEIAAKTNEPHRIAFYLYELAGDFHSLWNKGNEISELRFIQEEHHRESCIKMAMISAVLVVISSGLDILGVEPATHMN
ncbi:MAG: arginine--tRNA ligase, partial [Rhodobacterales bacterium]|nr:arginine--tRNA ligase [Rhodobacterales bacterium]